MKIVREEVATKAAVRLLVSGLGVRKCGRFHDRKLTQYDDWAQAVWLRGDTSQRGLQGAIVFWVVILLNEESVHGNTQQT